MAHLIWKNECGERVEGLTTWNKGEEFASLGIAHFIWYPEGKKGIFREQFPEFVAFVKSQGVPIPEWFEKSLPWHTREEFYAEMTSEKMNVLRTFLRETITYQATFIAKNVEEVLPKLVESVSSEERAHVSEMFAEMAKQKGGVYALADYLNFKGEGTAASERYCGEGWGLLQVLQNMRKTENPLQEFVLQAKKVLSTRVEHAPHEKKWLQGWHNRLDTYLKI